MFQIIARHLVFIQNFHGYLKFRVFAVSAFVDLAESTFAKDVSIYIVLEFELVYASMDGHFGGLLTLGHLQMVLLVAPLDNHFLSIFFLLRRFF